MGGIVKRVVILGAGTAGTIMANRLRKLHKKEIRTKEFSITVVDQDNRHVYQPGLLFVPFGTYKPSERRMRTASISTTGPHCRTTS
jgi:sulfide:quinone oxidoreductase